MDIRLEPDSEEEIQTHRKQIVVIPSLPGWFVLQPWIKEEPQDTGWRHEPVIAWRIETELKDDEINFFSYAYPICATDTFTSEIGVDILLRPDGKVTFVLDCEFDNEAEALEAYRAELIVMREIQR